MSKKLLKAAFVLSAISGSAFAESYIFVQNRTLSGSEKSIISSCSFSVTHKQEWALKTSKFFSESQFGRLYKSYTLEFNDSEECQRFYDKYAVVEFPHSKEKKVLRDKVREEERVYGLMAKFLPEALSESEEISKLKFVEAGVNQDYKGPRSTELLKLESAPVEYSEIDMFH